ncbi:hypothetical protein SMNI109538_03030 [Smaragdicoccus niigatensis]
MRRNPTVQRDLYDADHELARACVDTRIQTIYAGSTEIMKEIIGRDLAR